jgi:hypothetical protein
MFDDTIPNRREPLSGIPLYPSLIKIESPQKPLHEQAFFGTTVAQMGAACLWSFT